MRQLAKRLYTNPAYAKSFEWVKLITLTGSAQAVVQILIFISGILVIRLLPTQEYALYTLANSMLGVITILADSGIAAGAMAQGGKVWKDSKKLGVVLVTGLHLRKKFAIGSLLIASPALVYLLLHHGASALTTVLTILSLVPAFFAALSDSLLEMPLKLKQDIAPLQRNNIANNLSRFAFLCLTLFVFPWAYVAVLVSGISRMWANIRLRKIAAKYADYTQKPDSEVRKKIFQSVKKIMPVSIYYCLSGQITIWLISVFGSTKSLAQVGALTRLSTVLTIFSVMFTTLIVPRFARLPTDKNLVLNRFFKIQFGLLIISLLIVTTVSLFSKNILWILGSDFSNLNHEVVLITISSCISLIGVSTNQLLVARNIIVQPFVFIPCVIAVQIALAFIIPINQIAGVLQYGIYTALVIYVLRLINFFTTICKR